MADDLALPAARHHIEGHRALRCSGNTGLSHDER